MKTNRRFFGKVCLFGSKLNVQAVYVYDKGKVVLIAMMEDKKEMKVFL